MDALALIQLLPALCATGKTTEAMADLYDAAPTLAPLVDKSESLGQFIDKLPSLYDSGRYTHLVADVKSMLDIVGVALGDHTHRADMIAALKTAVGAK